MKYVFLLLLSWSVGFALPVLGPIGQLAALILLLFALVVAVMYYIDTRVTAVRI